MSASILEARERAYAAELARRLSHEILVAELEVPLGADAPTERPGGLTSVRQSRANPAASVG